MDLQEALALLQEAIPEVEKATTRQREEDRWYGSDLPRDLFVGTEDGETFWIGWVQGEYSDTHMGAAESAEEWESESRVWRRTLVEDGPWNHRKVVAHVPYRDHRFSASVEAMIREDRDCGHSEIRAARNITREVGSELECHKCVRLPISELPVVSPVEPRT